MWTGKKNLNTTTKKSYIEASVRYIEVYYRFTSIYLYCLELAVYLAKWIRWDLSNCLEASWMPGARSILSNNIELSPTHLSSIPRFRAFSSLYTSPSSDIPANPLCIRYYGLSSSDAVSASSRTASAPLPIKCYGPVDVPRLHFSSSSCWALRSFALYLWGHALLH
jgi:hypothetical protein